MISFVFLRKHLHVVYFTLQPLESCLQYSVTNYTAILNNTDRNTRREIGPFMFSEEQERAQIFIISSDDLIDENMHYHYHIRAYRAAKIQINYLHIWLICNKRSIFSPHLVTHHMHLGETQTAVGMWMWNAGEYWRYK